MSTERSRWNYRLAGGWLIHCPAVRGLRARDLEIRNEKYELRSEGVSRGFC